MSIIEKYELSSAMLAVMTDPKDGIGQLTAAALKLRDEVDAIDKASAESNDPTDKVDVLADRFGKDEVGQKAAADFLRANVFDGVVEFIDDDPAATFHLLNAVTDLLVKFLRDETNYHRSAMTPKAPKASRKGEFKSDYNELVKLIGNVANMAATMGYDVSSDDNLTTNPSGQIKSVLTGYRGAKASEDGSVTGRYAKVYSLAWTIDDEEIETGTPISTIVRHLWHGVDRIGKNAKSVTTLLDELAEGWTTTEFDSATFMVNGHEVTVSREAED